MVARSPNSDRKMRDDLPDVNVAADFYARYDIREVLGKLVLSLGLFIVWIISHCHMVKFSSVLFCIYLTNKVCGSQCDLSY